jgi:ABC-2 type transport system ATP-binding protein/lipopolysaccharide transport system ATP-binding protein
VTTSIAVDIQQVGKRFLRHSDRRTSLKEMLVRGRSKQVQDFWAVRDVTIQIPKGSVYGLIGHNGSGKSTLLKMIGGIYRPTTGSITAAGRIAALIELGAGFHPDLTGKENIQLNGSLLGLQRKEIAAVTEEIIDFSGLREFINEPVKHYSSGMYVRLGFAVAVHMKPDVLLVDEVLAVGDEEFQRKCFDHLNKLCKSGTTIIVVSHGLGQLEGLCDEVAWLEHGELQQAGSTTDTIAAYLHRVNTDEAASNPNITSSRPEDDRAGTGQLRVTKVEILSASGDPINHAETASTFNIRVKFDVREPILGPNLRIALQHDTGPLVSMISNHAVGYDFGSIDGEQVVDIAIEGNPLLPGRYRVHVDVFDHTGSTRLDTWNDAMEFPVRSQSGEIGQGFVQLPARFHIH